MAHGPKIPVPSGIVAKKQLWHGTTMVEGEVLPLALASLFHHAGCHTHDPWRGKRHHASIISASFSANIATWKEEGNLEAFSILKEATAVAWSPVLVHKLNVPIWELDVVTGSIGQGVYEQS